MKFRIDRDVFAEAVAWTARSVPARPPMPILAGLLLVVDGDGLTLSGFDYEVSARATVEARPDEPGTVLVSGRLLAEITRSLPAQPVDVVTEGSRTVLSCGAARFALPTLPVEDYPTLPQMPATTGTVRGDEFAVAVASVVVAAGRDDTLPVLTGVRLEIDDDVVSLAATDRYRLAVCRLPWTPARAGLSGVALVPARTLADAAKAFAGQDPLTIALATPGSRTGSGPGPGAGAGEGLVGFEVGGRRTTTRLLEGEFPKYRSLIPTAFSAAAEVVTGSFVEALRRVSLVAARNSPVRLSFGSDEVVLEAGTGEDAQAFEVLPVQFTGDPVTIAFNPAYLLDGLSAIGSDVARLSFTHPDKPVVVTPADQAADQAADEDADEDADEEADEEADDLPYRYLLMPVRLS